MFPMPWLLVCLSGEAAERDLSGEAAKRDLGGGAAKRDLHMRHQPPHPNVVFVIISVFEITVVEPFMQFKCSFR